uniref:Uncharacterized protein n=1 Tax=Solanum lycopersicum TaxID=4081 RepID=A0A3Q7GQZ6_SOLLC
GLAYRLVNLHFCKTKR